MGAFFSAFTFGTWQILAQSQNTGLTGMDKASDFVQPRQTDMMGSRQRCTISIKPVQERKFHWVSRIRNLGNHVLDRADYDLHEGRGG